MAGLSEEKRQAIIANNRKISRLLSDNEDILREAGYDPPKINFAFDPEKESYLKVQVPTGYIRTKDYYMRKYGLMKICSNDVNKAANIAYNLELSDFYNYIINRIGIYGPIYSMLSKQATINVIAIIEVLMKCYIETLHKKCAACPHFLNCGGRVVRKKAGAQKFQLLVDYYARMNLLGLKDRRHYQEIKSLYEYRNRIHLAKSKLNELKENVGNKDWYNHSIYYLQGIDRAMIKGLQVWADGTNCPRYKV